MFADFGTKTLRVHSGLSLARKAISHPIRRPTKPASCLANFPTFASLYKYYGDLLQSVVGRQQSGAPLQYRKPSLAAVVEAEPSGASSTCPCNSSTVVTR